MMKIMAHFGDPCIHCGIAHDDLPRGQCQGDPGNVVIVRYAVTRQAWQNPGSGCDEVTCLLSSGHIVQEYHHPSSHWPYSGRFKNSKTVTRSEMLVTEAANARRLSATAKAEARS